MCIDRILYLPVIGIIAVSVYDIGGFPRGAPEGVKDHPILRKGVVIIIHIIFVEPYALHQIKRFIRRSVVVIQRRIELRRHHGKHPYGISVHFCDQRKPLSVRIIGNVGIGKVCGSFGKSLLTPFRYTALHFSPSER